MHAHSTIAPPTDPRCVEPLDSGPPSVPEREDPVVAEASAVSAPSSWNERLPRSIRLLWFPDGGALTESERVRIIAELFPSDRMLSPHTRRFAALMTAAVLIAVMGLLADSTAIVIGAMLVAPLMRPILAAAAGIVMGWPGRVVRSLVVAGVASAGAVALAATTAFVFPGTLDPLPSEVMARTSPNLLDFGVALAAGSVGAYSRLRRSASDAITGVAVAVALVPPLAVVGILVRLASWDLALGASMLFLANVVGIVFAAAVTFLVCGLPRRVDLVHRSMPIVGGLRWALTAVLAMLVPLHVLRSSVLPPVDPTEQVSTFVTEVVGAAGADVMSISVEQSERGLSVDVVSTPSSSLPDAEALADQLARELDGDVAVELQIVDVDTEVGTAEADDAEVGTAEADDAEVGTAEADDAEVGTAEADDPEVGTADGE